MSRPSAPPDRESLPAWRDHALEYLRSQLGGAAPSELGEPAFLERSPLAGEGAMVVFPFRAAVDGRHEEEYRVVVGRTEPNYYPGYNLSLEETFDLHLGTRFMLVLGVAQYRCADDSYDPLEDARSIVARVAPGRPIEDLDIAAAFAVDDQVHTVLRCRIDGTPVYIMARDAPLGFNERTDLPPQVAYRLHLGQVLRREPNPADD